MALRPVRATRVLRVRGGSSSPAEDSLVVEEPLEIRVNGEPVAVTMRTPGDDEDLVRGFLVTEGIVPSLLHLDRLRRVEGAYDRTPGNVLDASVPSLGAERPWRRNLYASSSCGVCGKASIDMVRALRPRVDSAFVAPASSLASLPARLRSSQSVFERTGGLHAAGLFDAAGSLLAVREDVGRHNAVDKVVGWALASRPPPLDALLLVSGRAGFEIVQKAAVAGIPVVAAVGAPSSLAVELAEEANVGLAGFVRDGGWNVYAHPERFA